IERSREEQKSAPAPPPVAEAAAPAVKRESPPGLWADFRGPNRAGIYNETPILTTWPSTGLTRLWKHPVGGGYASFVVADGRAFTIEQRRGKEVVAAYDLDTGRELWADSWDALFQEAMGGDGPRATPTFHEGRVYALGAAGELRCLDAAAGKPLWRRNILDDNAAANLQWGMSSSPLIVDERSWCCPAAPPENRSSPTTS
ncbi:MAG: PQQ-binding-like beta-propeller repeat protein, partial [Bryobacteraceae bacterium]